MDVTPKRLRLIHIVHAWWLSVVPVLPTIVVVVLSWILFLGQPQVRETLYVVAEPQGGSLWHAILEAVQSIGFYFGVFIFALSLWSAGRLATIAHDTYIDRVLRDYLKAASDEGRKHLKCQIVFIRTWIPRAVPLAAILPVAIAFFQFGAATSSGGLVFHIHGALVIVVGIFALFTASRISHRFLPHGDDVRRSVEIALGETDEVRTAAADRRIWRYVGVLVVLGLAVWAAVLTTTMVTSVSQALTASAYILVFLGLLALVANVGLVVVRRIPYVNGLGAATILIVAIGGVHALTGRGDSAWDQHEIVDLEPAGGHGESAATAPFSSAAHASAAASGAPLALSEKDLIARRPTPQAYLAKWLWDRCAVIPGEAVGTGWVAGADCNPAGTETRAPYPLLIATAQGGGIRAAWWTAAVLAELHERRRLTCHLFAISAISGGSVGALAFNQTVRDLDQLPDCATMRMCEGPEECPPEGAEATPVSATVRQTFEPDFLAPVVGRMLFGDTLTGLIPFLSLPDRQRAIEAAFRIAYCRAVQDAGGRRSGACNERGFLTAVRPPAEGGGVDTSLPALFLIAADVEAGTRFIASDLAIEANTFNEAGDTLRSAVVRRVGGRDAGMPTRPIALDAWTAAGLSARFPWISPAGVIRTPSGEGPSSGAPDKIKLLDGGITESSGALTAAEIATIIVNNCLVKSDSGRWDHNNTFVCRLAKPKAPGEPLRFIFPTAADHCRPDDTDCEPSACAAGTDMCRTFDVRVGFVMINNAFWRIEDRQRIGGGAPLPSPLREITGLTEEPTQPVHALLNMREGRGREALSRLTGDRVLMSGSQEHDIEIRLPGPELDAETCGPEAKEHRVEGRETVPLGWVLSARNRTYMDHCVKALSRDESQCLDRWIEVISRPAVGQRADAAAWRERPDGVVCGAPGGPNASVPSLPPRSTSGETPSADAG